ncbi:hypothetical protein HBI81_260520 [Parastagonospora nodorum]|nr:hypothetical protein HBI81_260520 [Parastagonospora nodorum]
MDRFCTICGFQPKTYAGLAKHTAGCYSRHLAQQSLEPSENVYETLQSNETYTSLSNEYNTAQDRKVHVCAADGLSSTVTVYDHIEKDKNADLAIADGISDAPDMCAKDDLVGRKGPLSTSTQTWEVLFQTHDGRLAGEPATAESVTAKDPNHVDTFGSDFAFSFAAWLQRIKCTLGDVDSLFADARLHDLHTRLPFQSGRQWQEAMSAMQSGIQDDIWIQEDIAKTSGLSGLEADQHFFVYQNILSLIAFIISHRPFADELVYAPSQFFSGNTDYPVRVYHELHSGDWWWNIQQSLPDGATVVPIIISVDKTQLSLISGDVAAWPVYVTIGNLSREARRRRSTPGTLLAGFIPTTKIRDPLLKTLENAAKSGILLACADGRTRQCYPTICAILADYEEQVLLTGVKKNRHCTRCTVAPDDREDLCGSYPWRTEQFTRLQQERCLDKGHDDFVHPVDCFGWKHHNFNIHVSLATDTLHLLLKGLVMKMLDFMQDMLDDIYPGSRKTWDNSTTPVTQESGSTQLNERFRQVMHSTGLKRFNNKRAFTEVSQWTGTEQKAIIQQLVAVVSPLFVSKAPFALHFIRAVCDLVTLAQYKSHDEDTLAYIQGALERMNVFKEEFRVYRRTLGEEKNFNYPKWHALTHIIQDIRMYGALDGICTGANSEAHHITMVKQFYSMTNKKEYILQICLHNSRRTALLAADHATVVKQSRPSTTVDIQDRTYSTRVTRPLPFRRLGWSIPGIQPHSTKLPLSEVAANIAISDFTHAAAVFVRNKRQAAAGQLITSYDEDRLDVDPSWVGRMSVQIHPSIKCWRSSGKRHNDPEHCDEEVVRCAPNWQQTGLWRRDYVWVQEFEHGDNRRQSRTVTDGRVVAQLHLILTIIDHTRYDKDGKHMAYIGAFSEVLLFNNNGQIDNTTGMLSVRRRAWNAAPKRRTLQAFKFYDLSTIIRPVHLVPRDLPDSTTRTTMSYYVNNYIDWDEYNRLYSPTFDIDLLRTLREYRRKRTRNN